MKGRDRRQGYRWLIRCLILTSAVLLVVVIVPGLYTARAQSCGPTGDPCLGGGGGTSFSSDGSGRSPDCSPIIIDVSGDGFNLTSAREGVRFDIAGNGNPVQIAWTAKGAANAFLCLDRNGNGKIDSGKELFGNFTDQSNSPEPNGFLALAEFDKPENGGNGDGIIDASDKVFSSLRLWIDANHDGISQPEELFRLADKGITSISLHYKESRRMDQFGNTFRFRSRVNASDVLDSSSRIGKLAYDVFLVTR